ncbi:MAG TPA: glycoside hydrolase family 43 protein [bacterium]
MKRRAMPAVACVVFLCAIPWFASLARQTKGFWNPILAGFYPDPSLCRVGGDFYLVNSTFAYFPGIPIFHSRDLVSWRQIGSVMDRPEQLDLNGLGVSEGLFAPAIRYNRGVFYVTCTLVGGKGNFVVISKKPEGPWSDPVWLPQVNGIDPSLFFDEDGAYLLYNSIAPDDKPLYDGHRTIRMRSFNAERLRVADEEYILVNGGTDINRKPVWIEGPHLFKKDDFYFLIAAEGGTGDQHSEVVFRSADILGPYIPYEKNPILTQRHLNPRRRHPVTSTGHADFVQIESGTWWAVFLGCRPYRPFEEGHYNTGRETFLAPVEWRDGWPVVDLEHDVLQYRYPFPVQPVHLMHPMQPEGEIPLGGNFTVRDGFQTDTLNPGWMFLRTPREPWFNLNREKGCLCIRLGPETCAGNGNPRFIGRRQQHANGYAAASMHFSPEAADEKAGLLVFQNERHFYYLCQSLESGTAVVQLYQSPVGGPSDAPMESLASRPLPEKHRGAPLRLKIEGRGKEVAFFYACGSDKWTLLKDNVDARFLSTKTAGGFVGCMFAMYATSLGKPSDNTVCFDWFEYRGNDEVYR